MRKIFNLSLLFLIGLLLSGTVKAQIYPLTICQDSLSIFQSSQTIEGKLRLFRSQSFEAFNPFHYDLLTELKLNTTEQRIDSIQPGTYLIEYQPADTNALPSWRIFIMSGPKSVFLDGHFFNADFPPFSSRMKKGQHLIFHFPPPLNPFQKRRGDETYEFQFLHVQRIKNRYYVEYVNDFSNLGFQIIPLQRDLSIIHQSKKSNRTRLNRADLQKLIQFERNLKRNYFQQNTIGKKAQLSQIYYQILSDETTYIYCPKQLIQELKEQLWNDL
ncbi:MAG: hypothetical protein EP338_02930 [Bacteroidetes bacterium]|nr:MAG: hypothetical protein EP338_02930 [Bacteroidota bacterium]